MKRMVENEINRTIHDERISLGFVIIVAEKKVSYGFSYFSLRAKIDESRQTVHFKCICVHRIGYDILHNKVRLKKRYGQQMFWTTEKSEWMK